MTFSYKTIWKLLIDKDMKKKDLCAKAGISSASVTRMGRNGHVTTEILLKICTAPDCQVEDIMEIVPDKKSWFHFMPGLMYGYFPIIVMQNERAGFAARIRNKRR